MTTKQLSFQSTNWKHRFAHGGSLRKLAKGRGARPLSSREPLHLVFKINKAKMRGGLRGFKSQKIIKFLFQKYAKKFFVRIDQITIQHDHIHVIVRSPRRFYFQSFFKVIAGQIAQVFQKQGLLKSDEELLKPNQGMTATPKGTGLWKYRPFSRVIRGWKAYGIVRDYLQLNELEALGHIPYRKLRLKGLSFSEWSVLWA